MHTSRLILVGSVLLTAAACSSESGIGGLDTPTDTGDTGQGVPGEPVARAGDDQLIQPLDVAQLDGSASYDPDGGTITAYQWSILQQPSGSVADIVPGNIARPVLQTDVAGDYVMQLEVQNDAGLWDSTPDTMTVSAKPTDNFYVQLTWDTDETDLDLHLVQEPGPFWHTTNDVYWCNQEPEWGVAGLDDNPNLDNDEFDGFGPETTTIPTPAAGTYRIAVHYFGEGGGILECNDGCGPTNATVRVFVDTVEVGTWTRTLTGLGDMWTVATIEWPSKAVTEVNGVAQDMNEGC